MTPLPEGVRCCLDLVARQIGYVDSLIGGEPTVNDRGGRNWNLSVQATTGADYHIKLPLEAGDAAAELLRREVDFYSFCRDRSLQAVNRFLARLIFFDREYPFLVLETLSGASPLREHLQASDPHLGPVVLLGAVGGALGTVHAAFQNAVEEWATEPDEFPWAFTIHRPRIELFSTLSPATRQLLKILQGDTGFTARLENLSAQWVPQTLIHSDIKSDNVLVFPPETGREYSLDHIRFIDWETVRYGDPAWDVAGVLQDVAFFWICAVSENGRGDIEQMVASARYPWAPLQEGLRGFWHGYQFGAGINPSEADRLLDRAVPFSAARMIQTAWELARTLPTLPAESILLLQVASNLLNDPKLGLTHFYGLTDLTP